MLKDSSKGKGKGVKTAGVGVGVVERKKDGRGLSRYPKKKGTPSGKGSKGGERTKKGYCKKN